MKINIPTTNMARAIKAAIVVLIGICGSLLLKFHSIIGEAAFVTFTCLSVFVGVLLYFRDSLIYFSLGLSGIRVKLKPIDAIIAKETEPPKSDFDVKAFIHDDATESVVRALGSSKYTWRYFDSIAQETGIPPKTLVGKITPLINYGLVTQEEGIDGPIYGLSLKGRHLLSVIDKIA